MASRDDRAVDCGCCSGIDTETPARIHNRPGRSQISYRVGTHARFKESVLARLSSSSFPELNALGTRENSDLAIALCDALACSLDVLTFYQERLANEHYLRTATEERSVAAMARLIGYEPSPGVAASTYLAFTLQDAPGDTTQGAEPVTIPKGTRVQSVPGPGEKAQVFETVEKAKARLEWSSMAPQLTRPWRPALGDTDLYLDGVATRLEPGDAILIVGKEREEEEENDNWDVRVVTAVEPDTGNRRTRISWEDPLGKAYPFSEPAARSVRVLALRQRAALFGHNAPDPNMMTKSTNTNLESLLLHKEAQLVSPWQWDSLEIDVDSLSIDLDAAYPKITENGWLVLVSNEETKQKKLGSGSLPGYVELYRAESVRHLSRTGFGLSGKATRVELDTDKNLSCFEVRDTLVLAQSEELATVPRPVPAPVYGDELALDAIVDGLAPAQLVAVRGLRQRIQVSSGVSSLKLSLEEEDVVLAEGDSLVLLEAPVKIRKGGLEALTPDRFAEALSKGGVTLQLRVLDRDGQEGTVACTSSQVELEASQEDDQEVMEVVAVAQGSDSVSATRDRTILRLSASLANCYERSSVEINANVIRATHGETVGEPLEEIVGDGDASRPDQRFRLRQSPLTYVGARTPSGRRSTLTLRVNGLLWTEVPTLCGRGADERVYTVSTDDEGAASVQFGDGVEGARPPSGRNNIRAVYRKTLGANGNLAAGKITNLLSRPQGVKSATNPEPATGGENRESLATARDNAPLSVLTLDRAVSIKDYADFARAFAGIAKAHALWIPAGPARGVFVTVAGVGGASLGQTSTTLHDLLSALRSYGDPLLPAHVVEYRPAEFRTALAIKVKDDHDAEQVFAGVRKELKRRFAFASRDFGQGVSEDEVMAVAHLVRGVEAVRITRLCRTGPTSATAVRRARLDLLHGRRLKKAFRRRAEQRGAAAVQRLVAELPVASLTAIPQAAELLVLDEDALELGELS